METAGKILLGAALVLAVLGLVALAKLGVDRVPGALSWRSENLTIYVPLGLMILVSIVGTILLNIFVRR